MAPAPRGGGLLRARLLVPLLGAALLFLTTVLVLTSSARRAPGDVRRRALAPPARRVAPAACFPILLFCNKRPDLLERTLNSLLAVRAVTADRVVASQDGPNNAVRAVLERFELAARFVHTKALRDERGRQREGAALIAQHYKWAIKRAFAHFGASAQHLVIVEDDMLFAPDFMEYFAALAPLLEDDPTLWTVSAFNDNGYEGMAYDDERVLRTDWTVGFGWLLRRRLWEDELHDAWPKTHWDHWMRSPKRRKGRETLFPEVSRNFHTGARGTHSEPGLYERYFKHIRLSNRPNPRLMGGDVGGDMGALRLDRYDEWLSTLVSSAEPVRSLNELAALESGDDRRQPPLALRYAAANATDRGWERVATFFGLWHTLPVRGDHRGVLLTGHRGRRLLLVASWSPFAAQLRVGTPSIASAEFIAHGALPKLRAGWLAAAGAPPVRALAPRAGALGNRSHAAGGGRARSREARPEHRNSI